MKRLTTNSGGQDRHSSRTKRIGNQQQFTRVGSDERP